MSRWDRAHRWPAGLGRAARRMGLRTEDLAFVVLGALTMAVAAPPVDAWPVGPLVWVPLAIVASTGSVLRAGLVGTAQGWLAQSLVLAGLPAALRVSGGASAVSSWTLAILLALAEGARFGVIGERKKCKRPGASKDFTERSFAASLVRAFRS